MPIDTVWDRLQDAKELRRRYGEKEATEFFSDLWRKDGLWNVEALYALAEVGGFGPFVENLVKNDDVEGLVRVFALPRPRSEIQAAAVEAVKLMGDTRVAGWLVEALPEWRSEGVIWALGELREKSAVEPLAQILTNDQSAEAAESLAKIGDARAVEALVSALQHDQVSMRIEAAKALAAVTDPAALERARDSLRAALAPNYFTTRDWAQYERGMDERIDVEIKTGASEDEIVFLREQAARETAKRADEADALKAIRTALDRIESNV